MPGSAILTYHSLDDSGSVISIPPALFRLHMECLARARVPVVPLDRAQPAPGSIALTFDDGFRNFAEHALPVLQQYNFPATLFIVSEYCGKKNDWPEPPGARVPSLPLLSWEELQALPQSISIGAHTATHRNLGRAPEQECSRELLQGREQAEQRLGRPVRWLAYPYGASTPAVRRRAAEHFDLAVGTTLRFLSAESDRMDLPRIDAYYLRGRLRPDRLFSTSGSAYIALRRALRALR